MRAALARRPSTLMLAFGSLVLASCAKGAPAGADSAAAAPPAASVAAPAPRAQMGMMMGDTSMIMLSGFCGAEAGDSAKGAHVDLIVNGDAAQRASQVMINVSSAAAGELKAELVAGKDAHTMCGGHARRLYLGGTTMFLGNPTLTLSSDGPVTVAARSTLGAMLGTPIDVKPGQKGAVLKWDAAPAAKP